MKIYIEDEEQKEVTVFKGEFVEIIADNLGTALRSLSNNVMCDELDYNIFYDGDYKVEVVGSKEVC